MWGSPPPIEEDSERTFRALASGLLGKIKGSLQARPASPLVDFFERALPSLPEMVGDDQLVRKVRFGKEMMVQDLSPQTLPTSKKGMAQDVLSSGWIGGHFKIRSERNRDSLGESRSRGFSPVESISPSKTISTRRSCLVSTSGCGNPSP